MQEAEKKAAARRECPTMFILWPLPFDEEEGDYDEDFDKSDFDKSKNMCQNNTSKKRTRT